MGAARCVVAGCNLIDHDKMAPELHEGKSLVSEAWSVTPILGAAGTHAGVRGDLAGIRAGKICPA